MYYNTYHDYCRRTFGRRVQKISVNAGFTCPNRDGTKGTGGCAFCNNSTFNPDYCRADVDILRQIDDGILFFKKYNADLFFAYFQAYSNTYGETQEVIGLYRKALSHSRISGLVIGTRPDCLADDLLDELAKLAEKHHIVVELGAESCYNDTLSAINRGHTWEDSVEAVNRLNDRHIPVGLHMIMGLPGETREMQLAEAAAISKLPVTFLKLHQLQIVKGSRFAQLYAERPRQFDLWTLDDYIDFCIDFAERLNPAIVIERFVSQAPREMVVAPFWNVKNFEFVHKLEHRFGERHTYQGRLF